MNTIDPAEAARRLNICRHTIYDLINSGRLPAVSVESHRYPGRSWQINPNDLELVQNRPTGIKISAVPTDPVREPERYEQLAKQRERMVRTRTLQRSRAAYRREHSIEID
jgi:excisionase family DNA binding protein